MAPTLEGTARNAECKEQGNACMKDKKYFEAVLHYTKAIKIESNNPPFYSNRSLAFLKIDQYYYALEDARTTIKLMPKWTKGYFRKGEVEFKTEHFEAAMESYKAALDIDPNDETLLTAYNKAVTAHKAQKKSESRTPWFGAGIGLLLGMFIVLADQHLTKSPVMESEYIQFVLVLAFVAIGCGIAVAYRYFVRVQRLSLLDPPMDILGDDPNTPGMPGANIPSTKKNIQRKTKASNDRPPSAARHRQKPKS